MKIEILKHYNPEDVQGELARLAARYGSLDGLAHKASIGKCGSPDVVDNLVIWQALSAPGTDVIWKVSFESAEAVAKISPKRLELLEIIKKARIASLKELAAAAKRDYKNVYDDAVALEECGLIVLEANGRRMRPTHAADEMKMTFER
ncbi:MAG: hypothetical protein HZB92_03845 [Euryarchaeota archaeon]|nr:hypothetical protein [Euryarchaeota archaeon]